MLRVVASAVAAFVAVALGAADAAGVCYSPFYSPDYSPSGVAGLLERDFALIASQGFDSVRTYHAQFYGHSVVDAARKAGLKVALGIQMQSPDGGEYAYLEQDIQAAISAATAAPDTVVAIYAGNENLLTASGARIAEVIARVKSALRGTAAANVPVGTVQRLEEWLHAATAAQVAAASDVVGANIYPFFTTGGARDMQGALSAQWGQFAAKYGGKARLTETGWPSDGPAAYGNAASTENAAKYFAAFNNWAAQAATPTPFYFMMFDVPDAAGPDYEKHFGVATSSKSIKFQLSVASSAGAPKTESREIDDLEPATVGVSAQLAPTEAPTTTPAPTTSTPEPTTATPALTTATPTPEPTTVTPSPTPTVTAVAIDTHGSSSGSHGHGDEIHFPGDGSRHDGHGSAGSAGGAADVGDGSAGVVPAATTPSVPVRTGAPTADAAAPAATTLSPEAQAELEAKAANAQQARKVAGSSGAAFSALATGVGALGVAAMVVIGVYMRRRNHEATDEGETRTVAASSIDPRGSTPSVYDDPLGTRFSSIVMLTPNGDGVCIL